MEDAKKNIKKFLKSQIFFNVNSNANNGELKNSPSKKPVIEILSHLCLLWKDKMAGGVGVSCEPTHAFSP